MELRRRGKSLDKAKLLHFCHEGGGGFEQRIVSQEKKKNRVSLRGGVKEEIDSMTRGRESLESRGKGRFRKSMNTLPGRKKKGFRLFWEETEREKNRGKR